MTESGKGFFGGVPQRKSGAVRKLINLRKRGKLAHNAWGEDETGESCPVAAIGGSTEEDIAYAKYEEKVGVSKEFVDLFIAIYDELSIRRAFDFAIQLHREMSVHLDPAKALQEFQILCLKRAMRDARGKDVKKKREALLTLIRSSWAKDIHSSTLMDLTHDLFPYPSMAKDVVRTVIYRASSNSIANEMEWVTSWHYISQLLIIAVKNGTKKH